MGFTHQGRTLHRVAVIGSGQIGPDIALYFAKTLAPEGTKIVVVDIAPDAIAKGRAKLEKKVSKGVESGAFSAQQQAQMLASLSWTTDYAAIAGADFAVEAATESEGLKGKIFAQVEGLVAPDALLASNSSHLEPEVIFARAAHKERALVIHYFFPAERNLVVEIVPSAHTAPAVVEWLMSFYEAIGKVPVRVKSRYGYALDPVFEGLFQAAALLAEDKVATTKQIDQIQRKALGMTVGSFTAMNLTGGNPITNVGLDHYTSKIHAWFRSPASLKEKVANGGAWEVPARGEVVEVPMGVEQRVTDALRGAYFGLVGEIVDAGVIAIDDFDLALELALDMRPAFTLMNELGTGEALRLVTAYAKSNPGFPVPECIAARGRTNAPFGIGVVTQRDVDGVRVLTIRRPKVLNTLNEAVFAELEQKFAAADRDPAVQAVVLTGFGRKAFVSGADVNFLARIETPAQGEATSRGSQRVLDLIAACKKPSVAALNGLAFGGGIELAMACSLRIAKKGLKPLAAQPEANLGIIPGAGGTQRLPRLIGLERAAELLRTCRPISSEQALALGLIAEEVGGDLLQRAVAIARELASGKRPRPAIRTEPLPHVPASLPSVDIGHRSRAVDAILCRAILGGAKLPLPAAIAYEAKCFGEVCATKDMRIGVSNFLEHGPRTPAPFVHE
jgi:enoyl-CoA hydratase/3-hydroxyacyl-CoA dehydrogenase